MKGTRDLVRPEPDKTLGQGVACYYTCVFYRFGNAEAGILEFVGRESVDIPGSPRRRTGIEWVNPILREKLKYHDLRVPPTRTSGWGRGGADFTALCK